MRHSARQVILIGCDPELVSRVRDEIQALNAEIEAEFSDTNAAIGRLILTSSETRIIVMHVKSADDLSSLRRLADTFGDYPIVALIDPGRESSFILEVNRQGGTQVLALPLLGEDLRAAWKRIALQFGGEATPSEVIAVAGVTGGCGTTSIAANLAYEVAQRRGGPCLLVEPSLQLGKLANYFDVEPTLTTQDLYKHVDHLDLAMVERVLTPINADFRILAGPQRTTPGLSATPDDVKRVLYYARQLAGLIFLDVPCTMDDHYFQLLTAADRVLLITEQKIPSLRSLQVVCDVLDETKPTRPRIVVVNRYNPNIPGLAIKKLEKVLKTTGFQSIGNDYAAMNATIDHGRPLRTEAPRSRVLADLVALARVLFPELNRETDEANGAPLFTTLSRCLGLGKVAHRP